MKLRFILSLLAIVLLSASFMPGQAIFTRFTGNQVPPTMFLDFGTYLCPGGDPAGPYPPQPPCSPGSRVQVRGVVFQNSVIATDARMTGKYVITFNANTDGWTAWGPGSGPLWGTVRVEVAEGGFWEGNYTGRREVTASGASSALHMVAHGTGGSIEGLKAEWDISSPHNAPSTLTGRILAPGGK